MSLEALLGIAVTGALVLWVVRTVTRPRRPREADDVDQEELNAAEREVRDWGTGVGPEDEVEGSDWGPGAPGR